jgi:flagellar basal-body rod modification protein FlgD
MATVQSTGVASVPGSGNPAAEPARAGNAEMEDRFLKLLVAQMRNQNPLNPLDNAQVTSQIAQISTVSGIDRLNATLQALAAGFAADRTLQAAGMIGRGVLVPGSALKLEEGGATGGVYLPQPVDRLVVTVMDGSGIALHSVDLGPAQPGVVAFHWDGVTDGGARAANGSYTFSVIAQQGDTKIDAIPLSYGRVNGISKAKEGITLDVGGIGAIGLSEVMQIL